MTNNPMCLHCRNKLGYYSRGLCRECFQTPEIVALFPPKVRSNPDQHWGRNYEPSMEELEALIQERYPTMPKRGAWEE